MMKPRTSILVAVGAGVLSLLWTLVQGEHILLAFITGVSVGLILWEFILLVNLITAIVLKRQEAKPFTPTENVNRTVYVRSQGMRINITINAESKEWTLAGTPANHAEIGDEVVDTQTDLLEIYQQYGLRGTIGPIEKLMTPIERRFGKPANDIAGRKAWTNSGKYE